MGKKNRVFSGWLVMVLGLVVAIGFGTGPALAADKSEADEQIGEEVLGGGTVMVSPFDQEAVFDDSFGDKAQATFIPSWAFEIDGSGQAWNSAGPAFSQRYSTSGVAWWNAAVRLPSGCRVTQVSYIYYRMSGPVTLTMYRENSPTDVTTLYNYTYSGSLTGWLTTTWFTSQRISNASGWYFVRINLDSAEGSNQKFWGVRILWERDVRPGLSHPFTDIGYLPQLWQDSIAALKASGITSGTSATTYSPGMNVTRGQMAVFLAKALGLYWAYPSY